MLKSEFSKITGQANFQGTNLVEPTNYITLGALGDRFNADHFILGHTQKIADGNWFTQVSLGISPDLFTQQTRIMSPAATGLLSAARGLLNGRVKQIADDPQGQYRILVDIPMFDAGGAGLWARLSNFYATGGAGAFFIPEVGDEVVVGFLNEDPHYPVILGSMYSSTKIKPYPGMDANEQNRLKAIVSRSGVGIAFDDMDKTLTICTPAKNSNVFSDKDKQVSVKDENGNSLVMSADVISIKSPKDINIQSDQKINIRGTLRVNMQSAGGDVYINALNIKETAEIEYNANGNATAKVSAGTELALQAAMILIN
jgi:uncharacterized protein involved in type VI secretion and phage assembly